MKTHMDNNADWKNKNVLDDLYYFVIGHMKNGLDKYSIAKELSKTGLDETKARELVEPIYNQILKSVLKERYTPASLQPALFGGLSAALVGGVIWGAVVIYTGYEAGIIAWLLGWLAGYAVVLFTRGKKGLPLQVIAVVSSLLGILFGKYLIFFYYYKEDIVKKLGEEAAKDISFFSSGVLLDFFNGLGKIVDGYDLVWVIFAVLTAWKIPKDSGIKIPNSQIPPYYFG